LDLLEALRTTGANVDRLCKVLALDVARLRAGGRVQTARILRLLDAAARDTGDEYIGLHAGQHAVSHDALVYFLFSCRTLEEGLRKAAAFAPLMISTLRMDVVTQGNRTAIVFHLGDETLANARHLIDYMLMIILRMLRSALGDRLAARAIHVAFPDRHDGVKARAFGCPVRFGHPDTQLILPTAALRRAPRVANPDVAAQIEKLTTALLAQMDEPKSLRERVAITVQLMLARGLRPERTAIARRLGMSDRTLQRGLEREETTFKRERDAVVRDTVSELLADPTMKIEAVALSAGFARASAFVKAFKRWTGRTPTDYRKALRPQQVIRRAS